MDLLHVSGIGLQEGGHSILQDISFVQPEFHKIAIAGETGSGKSTLLQIIAGLVQPDSGQVLFDQQKIIGPHDQLIPGHPGIAYLSQQFELPQFLRVEQVLQYANKLEDEDAENLFGLCRITHLLKRKTSELSGGERQRIALTRLLLGSPRLLLLDEPYSNLDAVHKNILKTVVQEIGESLDITLILISHDPQDTLSWADEILVMQSGKLLQQGTPQQIYQQPVNEYAAGLFGSYNLIPAALAKSFFKPLVKSKNESDFLIRPEHFKLSDPGQNVLTGTINKVTFYGSYSEVEVLLKKMRIVARTTSNHFRKGHLVSVSVDPENVWAL